MAVEQHALNLILTPEDNERLSNLCGQLDENLRLIERRMGVEINNRGHHFTLLGDADTIQATNVLLQDLYKATKSEALSPARVHVFLQQASIEDRSAEVAKLPGAEDEPVIIRTRRGQIRPRGANQQAYVRRVLANDLNFGIGPAGTGKTYLAVACAVDALERDKVRRILLTRPAVEAGERLGFLPGDLSQKIDPYLRPLYDALYEMLGFERVGKLIERNVIEIAPLAYMRGRTLNESFVILDEAQNSTAEQMKMFLTRIGFGSTAVVTGDVTQVDLPPSQRSGLREAAKVLTDIEGISFTFFKSRDVVRHPLVQKIVDAYEKHSEE